MELIGETILKWLITFILGTIAGYILTKLKKDKEKSEKDEEKDRIMQNAVQALLRDRLIEKYRTFKSKGEMTILDKENIEHLFQEYTNLGGNGTVRELYQDLDNIKIKIIKE